MPSLLKLPDVWRVLREIDLDEIRRDAEARFRLIVWADDPAEAEALVHALAGGPAHPWIEVQAPGSPVREPSTVTVALTVTAHPELGEELSAAVRSVRAAGVPVLTVVHGRTRSIDGVPRPEETARVVVTSWSADRAAIATALVEVAPLPVRLALARQLPPLRAPVISSLIEDTARANGAYAFTAGMAETVPVLNVPMNVADVVVLTKNQLLMGYKIALAAGKTGRPRQLVGEIVTVIGGGMLFRQAARSLAGLFPLAGLVPKVVVAYAGTWAIGRTVQVWATEGRRASSRAIAAFSRQARERGRLFAGRLMRGRRARVAPRRTRPAKAPGATSRPPAPAPTRPPKGSGSLRPRR